MEKDLGSVPRTDKCVVGALITFQKDVRGSTSLGRGVMLRPDSLSSDSFPLTKTLLRLLTDIAI